MTIKTVYYALGDHHSAQEWATIICTLAQAERMGEQTVERTWLDTFDWLLCRQDIVLCLENHNDRVLRWMQGDEQTTLPVSQIPKWSRDLPQGRMQKQLAALIDPRALLELGHVQSQQILLGCVDKKGRTRVRLTLEVNFQRPAPRRKMIELGCVLRVDCLAGYEKDFAKTLPRFDGFKKITAFDQFEQVVLNADRIPMDYSSKMKIKLDRDMRSDEAAKVILLDQLDQIERNIDGTKSNIDIEFLHDLRVAVRRSRSALSRLKGVFPETVQTRFSAELAWIGSITTPVRDLDVYKDDFPKYQAQLRKEQRNDLDPLYDFLLNHYDNEHKQLVDEMNSARFRNFLTKWRHFLERPLAQRPTAPAALSPIGEIADKRIWKTYRRLISEGSVIGDDTEAEALHDLRKTGKKLRYLLEFFASLYPAKDVGDLVKILKGLQENLGDFQDLDVQADTLHDYSAAMMKEGKGTPATFMSMGVLVEQFMERKSQVRAEFSERFAAFSSKEVEKKFRDLVGKNKRTTIVVKV